MRALLILPAGHAGVLAAMSATRTPLSFDWRSA